MDDALQEVAVKAARALPTLRDPDAIGAWLSRTTYRTCVDLLRRQRRLVLLAPDELPEPDGGGADFVDELAARDAVARLLATLTPEQRVAVVLVDQEGLDYRLAAEILDIPAGTIGSRLSKARAVLRRAVTASRLEERS
jgi:RNA polymerase sigma-70 factor (ECF subfamily)